MLGGPQLTLAIVRSVGSVISDPLAAARENGMMDPTALFLVFFGIYDGVFSIRVLSERFALTLFTR